MELSSIDAVFGLENMREASEPKGSASHTGQPDITRDTDWRFE